MIKSSYKFVWLTIGLILGVVGWFLSLVFSGQLILHPVVDLGFLEIRYYGLILALAVTVSYALAIYRKDAYGLTTKQADQVLLITLVSGFVGSRLYHVLSDWNFYLDNPQLIIAFWRGGLSIMGAILGGLIGLIIFSKLQKQFSLLKLLDWIAPSIVTGQIIGRFGNLFNYEAYGYPASLPWKMFVPEQFRIVNFLNEAFYHPLFLYELLGNSLILLFLFIAWPKLRQRSGSLFFVWLFLYNALRFVLEHLRIDSTFIFHNIRLNAVTSIVLAVVALAGLYKIMQTKKSQPLDLDKVNE